MPEEAAQSEEVGKVVGTEWVQKLLPDAEAQVAAVRLVQDILVLAANWGYSMFSSFCYRLVYIYVIWLFLRSFGRNWLLPPK